MTETLKNINHIIDLINIDTNKVFNKGNHAASIRARKNAQKIKQLIAVFRKEVITEIKKHDTKN